MFADFINADLSNYDFRFAINLPLLAKSYPNNNNETYLAIDRAQVIYNPINNQVFISPMPHDIDKLQKEIEQFKKTTHELQQTKKLKFLNSLNTSMTDFEKYELISQEQPTIVSIADRGGISIGATEKNHDIKGLLAAYFPNATINTALFHLDDAIFYCAGNVSHSICIGWMGDFSVKEGAFLVGPAEFLMNRILEAKLESCLEVLTDKYNRITFRFTDNIKVDKFNLADIFQILCNRLFDKRYKEMVDTLLASKKPSTNQVARNAMPSPENFPSNQFYFTPPSEYLSDDNESTTSSPYSSSSNISNVGSPEISSPKNHEFASPTSSPSTKRRQPQSPGTSKRFASSNNNNNNITIYDLTEPEQQSQEAPETPQPQPWDPRLNFNNFNPDNLNEGFDPTQQIDDDFFKPWM